MTTLLPLQFLRQYAGPMDEDVVFNTSAARLAYLSSPRRFSGQIVGDAQEGKAYILNPAMNAWTLVGSVPVSDPATLAMAADTVFLTTAARVSYLTSPRRFAGQVVSDLQADKVFVLNSVGTAWVLVGPADPTTGMAMLALANIFTKAQTVTPVALTDAATIATDASLSNTFTVTLSGDRMLGNPTNMANGVILNYKIKQDSVGGRTLAYDNKFKWAGTAPVLSTAPNARDFITVQYFSDEDILVSAIMKGVS